jgi:hypothetical protein
MEVLFPLVVASMDLHLHETLVCNDAQHVTPELKKPIASMSDEELFNFLTNLREARSGPPILRHLRDRG